MKGDRAAGVIIRAPVVFDDGDDDEEEEGAKLCTEHDVRWRDAIKATATDANLDEEANDNDLMLRCQTRFSVSTLVSC